MRTKKERKQKAGGLSDILPNTTWGSWSAYPGALAWSAQTQAPSPLANGGIYSGPQSTGSWASHPMPATQYAFAMEAAKTANNPDVFYQQRPNDNTGASFSPYVGSPASSQHYSATMGPKLSGGSKKNRRYRKQRGGEQRLGGPLNWPLPSNLSLVQTPMVGGGIGLGGPVTWSQNPKLSRAQTPMVGGGSGLGGPVSWPTAITPYSNIPNLDLAQTQMVGGKKHRKRTRKYRNRK